MAIDKLQASLAGLKPIQTYTQVQNQGKAQGAGKGGAPTSFVDALGDALSEVDKLQKDADSKIDGMMMNKGVKTHEAMIALEKADIAFRLMNNIRGRIIRAYEEVIRMQA